eukprot:jgi/Botrbrau1/8043/Bobra.13_2s0014.2
MMRPEDAGEVHEDGTLTFLRSWAWKREHRVRFHRPYTHTVMLDGSVYKKLVLQQAAFSSEGFASTVWDSAIVISKYFERWPALCKGKWCLDLSAGCGLVGLVLGCLNASVAATDLAPNLQLLQRNFTSNGISGHIMEHRWGADTAALNPPFDVIVACDVMYVEAAVGSLVDSLVALSSPTTLILVAHGRNRQAEPAFLTACLGKLALEDVPYDDLHPVYRCSDVRVCRLRCLGNKDG